MRIACFWCPLGGTQAVCFCLLGLVVRCLLGGLVGWWGGCVGVLVCWWVVLLSLLCCSYSYPDCGMQHASPDVMLCVDLKLCFAQTVFAAHSDQLVASCSAPAQVHNTTQCVRDTPHSVCSPSVYITNGTVVSAHPVLTVNNVCFVCK